MKKNTERPQRCIDPVMKCCKECKWNYILYPEMKTTCILGYDQGRPVDEPTDEEIQKWLDETIHLHEKIIEYQERLRSKRTDSKEE